MHCVKIEPFLKKTRKIKMIKIIVDKISKKELTQLCKQYFKHFVKFVVDIKKKSIAVGGEMHADAEALLLENGSKQKDLWGGNLYPENDPEERVEYESFINIRPTDDNFSMCVGELKIKDEIRRIVELKLLSPDEQIKLDK